MSERLNVLYQGETVCAFELIDLEGQYIEEVRATLRDASQAGELTCPDCGKRMVLCAGAVLQPYFRHFKLEDCTTGVELRTKSGKSRYACKKALFHLLKNMQATNVRMEETCQGLNPILYDTKDGTVGYVYLDGKTRNFSDLRIQNQEYEKHNIRLYFFLNVQYKSHAQNITSDEAECEKMNGGEIFYLDAEKNVLCIRKRYQDCNGATKYYEEAFPFEGLTTDESGKITHKFLSQYHTLVKEEKKKFKKVKRIPAEDGISEEYEELDFLLMDALEEIWILPRFQYRMEHDEKADRNRLEFLEQQNRRLYEQEPSKRELDAWRIADYIAKHLNSWDWI